jgi:carboxypeptidase C (cathepsin A)
VPGPPTENGRSPLDLADIVMIDPVDTGYSRAMPGDSPQTFFDTLEDGHATAELIRAWLAAHGRTDAPVFLIGESFGCQRATVTAHELSGPDSGVRLGGIVLISQALNMNEVAERRLTRNIVGAALSLPTLARLAWYHRLIDRQGRDEETFLQSAEAFAGSDYLAALFQGRNLPEDRRRKIASQLEAFTGIPAPYYLAHDLMISRDAYRTEALRAQGRVLATFDARYSAPVEAGKAAPDPFLDQVMAHFRDEATKTLTGMPHPAGVEYRVESADALKVWTFGSSPAGERPFVRDLEEALAAHPNARLLIFGGRYDLASTEPTTHFMLAQSPLPLDRTRVIYLDTGHMVYTSEAGLTAFADAVRAMLRAAAPVAHQPE